MILGPKCPPIFPGLKKESCEDKPYQATVIVKTEDGFREVTLFSSDRRGEFRVGLRPGTYRLEPLPRGFPYPSPDTQIVKVEPGKFANVKILYDTGIRYETSTVCRDVGGLATLVPYSSIGANALTM